MDTSTRHDSYTEEVGFVTAAKDYLLHLEGLPSVRINDVIENDDGKRALVLALNEDLVQALMFDAGDTYAGDRFFRREKGIVHAMGEHLFGRVINSVGDHLDNGRGFPPGNTTLRFEHQAPDINTRADITEQLHTGVSLIDTVVPIGKGQRQLIVGPFGSGKELFLTDTILNQTEADPNLICIYACIGKPLIYIEQIIRRLLSNRKNPKTIILTALSNDPAPMIYIAPSAALSIAEFFSKQGKEVLVVLDDLGTHARYLREVELLAGRIPGRESYPGDIFYQHAHIMERAGKFNKRGGGGSITLLPVLETNIEELSDLIATNIMAATDGHTFFSSELHAEGYYPAALPSQSVTRVGRKTQSRLLNDLSVSVQALLAEYDQQKEFSRFGAELSETASKTIKSGEFLHAMLQQETGTNIAQETQIILLGLALSDVFLKVDTKAIEIAKPKIIKLISSSSKFAEIREIATRGVMSLPRFIKTLNGAEQSIKSVWQH